MADIELKPCPFCGGKAKLKKGFPYQQNSQTKYAFIQCTKCRAKAATYEQYPFQPYESILVFAARDWNRRIERHGEWYGEWKETMGRMWECSVCGQREIDKSTYCRRCGAKMVGYDG